jgi:hypothetical protein
MDFVSATLQKKKQTRKSFIDDFIDEVLVTSVFFFPGSKKVGIKYFTQKKREAILVSRKMLPKSVVNRHYSLRPFQILGVEL